MLRPIRNHPGLALLVLLLLAGAIVGGRLLVLRAWADWNYRAAVQAVGEHDLDRAREHLARCLRARPDDVTALRLAARTARRADAVAEAEKHLQALEAVQGRGKEISLERLLLRAQQGQLEREDETLRALVHQDDPDTPHILEALARGYEATLQTSYSLDSLDLLLERWPDHANGRLLRGRCLEGQGRHEEAVQDYQKAVELAPRWADARLALAETLNRLGRPREAVAAYETALRLRLEDPVAPVGLAECRYDLGDTSEALRCLEALLARYPNHVPGLVERGRLQVRSKQAALAESDLRRAVSLNPASRAAHRVLLLCLEAQGKEGEAGDVRRRLDRIEADLMRIKTLKGKLQENESQGPHLYGEIGALLLGLQRDEEGVRYLTAALRIDPHFAPAHLALADYLEKAGQSEEARRHRQAARKKQ